MKFRKYLILALLAAALLIGAAGACKTSEETGPLDPTRQEIERSAGYTAATAINLANNVFLSAIGLLGAADAPAGSQVITYDTTTGWWRLSIVLEKNQEAEIQVQFLDSSGQFHKYYSLSDTTTINTTGEGSGPNGSFTHDFTISGLGSLSTKYQVDGFGTSTYMGTSVTYTITAMIMDRLGDGIPGSGSMALTVENIGMTIVFNGSETVQVTYTYKSFSYTITVNLKTGEIS